MLKNKRLTKVLLTLNNATYNLYKSDLLTMSNIIMVRTLHKKTFFNLLTRRPLSVILIPVMKLKEIKNGSIYYNTKKNRPERVISNSFSSSRVVTECPRKSQTAVSTSNIRLANSAEVEKYLNKTRKGNLMTFFGRLFSPKKLA